MTVDEIERACVNADLLLYTRTWGMTDPVGAIAMMRRVEKLGVVTASFHLDLYLGLGREATLDGDPFWSTQFVFTPDGDPASQAQFEARGIQHVWSPPAVHGPECVPGRVVEAFEHDVVFVGSYPYPHLEWPYRNKLVEWLGDNYGEEFKRYGGGSTVIRNEPLNDLYRSAGCVIGDSLCPGFTKPNYWSDRITETLGRGGVLIWPNIAGCAEFYGLIPGIHFFTYEFNDFDTLRSHITYCVENPESARVMADSAQEKIALYHTYRNRMEALIEAVGLD